MYHTESMSAECKLKEAEKQVGRSGEPAFSMRMEDKNQRRSSTKKIEKMKEKVWRPRLGARYSGNIIWELYSFTLTEPELSTPVSLLFFLLALVSCFFYADTGTFSMYSCINTHDKH